MSETANPKIEDKSAKNLKTDVTRLKEKRQSLSSELSALRSDLSALVNQFALMQTLNYVDFAEIWQRMRMPEIIVIATGQRPNRELQMIMEVAISHSTKIFSESTDQKTKIYGALYLLYALYMVQPTIPKVKIRFVYETWSIYKDLIADAIICEQWDAVHVGSSLVEHHAFHFCATDIPLITESKELSHLESPAAGVVPTAFSKRRGEDEDTTPNVDELIKRLASDTDELELAQSEYMQAKQALGPLKLPGLDRTDTGNRDEIITKIRRLVDL